MWSGSAVEPEPRTHQVVVTLRSREWGHAMIILLRAARAILPMTVAVPIIPIFLFGVAAGEASAAELCSDTVADRNNDGYIDGTEYLEYGHGAFARWDENRDGHVDRDEFLRCYRSPGHEADLKQRNVDWQEALRDETWRKWDRNMNNTLEERELFAADTYVSWDIDGDGRIDDREFPY